MRARARTQLAWWPRSRRLPVGCGEGGRLPGVPESVLIANRGEIARRIIRTARRLGIRSVAVYSEADADLPFVAEADQAVPIGPPPPAPSYLDVGALLAAARRTGAAALPPRYGVLAENPALPRQGLGAGLLLGGPPPRAT